MSLQTKVCHGLQKILRSPKYFPTRDGMPKGFATKTTTQHKFFLGVKRCFVRPAQEIFSSRFPTTETQEIGFIQTYTTLFPTLLTQIKFILPLMAVYTGLMILVIHIIPAPMGM